MQGLKSLPGSPLLEIAALGDRLTPFLPRAPKKSFVTKGSAGDVDWSEIRGLLAPFQVEKLRYFFEHFLDHDKNGIVNVGRKMKQGGNLSAGLRL